jgi:hypothetical protein
MMKVACSRGWVLPRGVTHPPSLPTPPEQSFCFSILRGWVTGLGKLGLGTLGIFRRNTQGGYPPPLPRDLLNEKILYERSPAASSLEGRSGHHEREETQECTSPRPEVPRRRTRRSKGPRSSRPARGRYVLHLDRHPEKPSPLAGALPRSVRKSERHAARNLRRAHRLEGPVGWVLESPPRHPSVGQPQHPTAAPRRLDSEASAIAPGPESGGLR